MKTLLLVASLALTGCSSLFAPDGWWPIDPEADWREDFAALVACAGAAARQTNFDRVRFRASYDLPAGVDGRQIGRWDVYLDAALVSGERADANDLVATHWLGEGAGYMSVRSYAVRHEMLHVVLDRRGHHYPFTYCIGL